MKRQILTVSILLVAAQLFGQESRFWVGGSGSWTDESHWSTTSGGEPGATVPESGISVVFDENSFSGARNTVSFSDAVQVGSFTATDANFALSGKKDFTVSGSINVDANVDFGKMRGALVLSGEGNNTINIFPIVPTDVIIDGGSWTLASDLKTEGNITLKSGSFSTAGHNMEVAEFLATEDAEALNIVNSNIVCDKWFTRAAKEMSVKGARSNIALRGNMKDNVTIGARQVYNNIYSLLTSKSTSITFEDPVYPSCPYNSQNNPEDGSMTVIVSGATGDYRVIVQRLVDGEIIANVHSSIIPLTDLKASTYYACCIKGGSILAENTIPLTKTSFQSADDADEIKVISEAECWGDEIKVQVNVIGGEEPYKNYKWEIRHNGTKYYAYEKTATVPSNSNVGLSFLDNNNCEYVYGAGKLWRYLTNSEGGYTDNSDYVGPELIKATLETVPSCEEEEIGSITVTATGGTAPYTYHYSKDGGTEKSTSSNIIEGLAAGTYTIRVEDSKIRVGKSEGCTNLTNKEDNVLQKTVYEYDKAVAEINNVDNDSVCKTANTYPYTATRIDTMTYKWEVTAGGSFANFSGGSVTGVGKSTATLNLTKGGDATVTLTVTNKTCQPATTTKTLHVIKEPKPSNLLGGGSYCVTELPVTISADKDTEGNLTGGRLELVPTSTPTGEDANYNGMVITDFPKAGVYKFKVKQTEPRGCEGLSDDEVVLDFFDKPIVNTLKASKVTVCEGDKIKITADITYEKDITISWEKNGETYSAAAGLKSFEYTTSASDILAGQNQGTVKFTIKVSNDQCDADDVDVSVTVNRMPSPKIEIDKTELCSDGTATITVFDRLDNSSTFTWDYDKNNLKIEGDQTDNPTVTFKGTFASDKAEAGPYNIKLTETLNGCSNTTPVGPVSVKFFEKPTIALSAAKAICEGNQVTITATTKISTVDWVVNGGSPTSGGKTYTYTSTGSEIASGNANGTVSFQATVTNSVCGSILADTSVRIDKKPTPTVSLDESLLCEGSTTKATVNGRLSGSTLSWVYNTTKLNLTPDNAAGTATIGIKGTMTETNASYPISVKETNGVCPIVTSSAESLTFDQTRTLSFDPNITADTVCATEPKPLTVKTNCDVTEVSWSHNGKGTPANGTGQTFTYEPKLAASAATISESDEGKAVAISASVVTNSAVCPAPAPITFNLKVNVTPRPELPDTTKICGYEGDIVANLSVSSNKVRWQLPAGVDSVGTTVIDGVASTATLKVKLDTLHYAYGIYQVKMTEDNGLCNNTASTKVKFEAKPKMKFEFEEASICAGEPFTIRVTEHENFDSYTWANITDGGPKVNAGPGDNEGTIKTTSIQEYREYIIQARPEGGCTTEGGQTMKLKVFPTPKPVLRDTIVCGLEYDLPTVKSSVTKLPKGVTSNRTWGSLSTGAHVDLNNNKFIADKEGTYTLRLQEQVTGQGCEHDTTAQITFVAKPEAYVMGKSKGKNPTDNVCADSTYYELSADTLHCKGFEWLNNGGDGYFVSDNSLTPTYYFGANEVLAGEAVLSFVAKAKTPCGIADNDTSTLTITINKLPEPTLTGDDVVCANSSHSYLTDAGMSNYVWKVGADTVAKTDSLNDYLWNKAANIYNLTVTYTDGNGCKPATPKTLPVTVNQLPGSKLPIVDTVCTNGSIVLNATDSVNTVTPYNYVWTDLNGESVAELLGGNDGIAMPTFASLNTGTYSLICTITDGNSCEHKDTIAVTVVPGPVADAGKDFSVCYGDTAQLHGDFKFADGAIWKSLGDNAGKFMNKADTATKFIPGPNDWANRSVTLVLTADNLRCGSATDTVELTLHPELQVAVGTVKPFDIAESTKITVEVEGTYKGGSCDDFEIYLVSPNGKEVELISDHSSSDWEIEPGAFKILFTTESTTLPHMNFGALKNIDEVFGIADRSVIYGENPAEGGWAVKIGGIYQNNGTLFAARISFTDHKDNIDTNPTKTIKFDSKVIDKVIPIKKYLTYRSPIGLNESCFGMCDAHAIATGIGGAGAGYTFTWVNDSTGVEVTPQTADGAITMLCAGDYTVTVTDGNQCSAFTSVHVGAPEKINISQDSIRNVACHGGSDGYIELSASKESITHFDFEMAGFNVASSNDTSATFSGLPWGNGYKVIVTDEDGCRDSLEFDITQPDTLEITSAIVTKASSCVANNGEVTFEVKGGSGNYVLEYAGDAADQPEIVIDSLTATNIKGSNSVKFRIRDVDALLNLVDCYIDTTINTARDTLIVSLSPVENLCAGYETGTITASVSNGSGKYTYQWLDGNGNAITDSTSSSISKLKEGTYSLYVLDTVSKCDITSKPVTLNDPAPFKDTIIFTQAIQCYGDNVASFYAEAKGGTAANKSYNYTWFNFTENTEVADSVLSNVGAGKYAVTITDDNNCPIYDTITIQQPEKPLAVLSADTVKSECAVPTGKIKLNLEGGVQPYSFSWFVVNTTDIIGTADSIKDIAADIYVAKIVDSLGCAIYDTVEVLDKGNIEFGKPVTKDVACIQHPTGEATINTVYGLDADGNINNVFTKSMIIWNGTDTVAQGETVKTLHYGSNRVVVVADDGCRRAGSVDIGNTLALRVTNIANYPDLTGDPNCDGSLTVTIGGGIGGYTYSWSDASNNSLESQDAATTTTVYSLCEGYYTLHIEDENPLGCAVDTTIQIEHRPLSCDTIQLVATTCYGGDNGVLEVSGVGGYYEAYKYEWTSENWPADSVATTASISGLKAGLYTVVISQSNGRVSDTTTIEVGQPSTRLHIPDANIIPEGSFCYNAIGTITIVEPANLAEEFGGNVPFKYYFSHSDWTDSVVVNSGAKPVKVTGLATDDYNLLVVDDLGCQYDTVITVPDLSEFTITRTDSTAPRCFGYEDGKLSIEATSKSSTNFTYQWNNGETTASIGGLAAGTYSVIVTDDSLCVKTDTFELGQPMPIVFSVSSTIPNSCYNLSDGTIEISGLEGGAGLFNRFEFFGDEYYEQTPSVDTSVISFSSLLPTGNYKVRVTDVKSCVSDSVPFRVYSEHPEIMVLKVDLSLPLCDTYTDAGELSLDGSLNVTAFYSVSSTITGVDTIENKDLRYRIDGGKVQSSGQFSGLASGRHTITIGYGDTLSCSTTVSRKLGSRNGFAIDDIYFANTQSDKIFTCPDNELKAYAHTTSAYKSMKWYTPYVEEEEEEETVVEPDTTSADTTRIDTALAISKMRHYFLRANGDSTVLDSVISDSIQTDSVPVAEVPVKPRYVIDADGNVVLGVDSVGSEPDFILPFTFLPYGGDTYYYVKATNGVCMAIDSLHAVAMKPDNKLKTHIEMDGFDSEALKNNGVYEVAEGAELYLVANTLTFDMLYSYEYENNFQWATNTDNAFWMSSHDTMPAVVRPFAENLTFKVSDSVMFYLEDTTFACRYTESVDVRTVSGIKPADVFTPNGDAYNETWGIDGLSSYEHVNIYVFNRWGGRVWQFSGSGLEYVANQWNGRNAKNKPLPSGTYYYVIQCSSDKLGGKKKTGPVTIVR